MFREIEAARDGARDDCVNGASLAPSSCDRADDDDSIYTSNATTFSDSSLNGARNLSNIAVSRVNLRVMIIYMGLIRDNDVYRRETVSGTAERDDTRYIENRLNRTSDFR